ncbi:YlbD family protein [Pseudogracilibacillus auburnensis]|uniref:YlbD family protein n=1 Tax=Pseudogracilibacillus auburnensis TaxID=1494959 RepID=UPI001A9749E6|nr:YlbD family protein [Pseudogracilibacillus auburnensis]MBO1004909.1 YlbD family protein [Pseudogracilibacillus auburnensis]
MADQSLHPSVEKFKQFVQENPSIIKSVRSGEETWQNLYEDWYLLGPTDPKWKKYNVAIDQSSSKNSAENDKGMLNHLTGLVKNMDANQIQYYVQQLSKTLGSIQGVLSQFQGGNQQSSSAEPPKTNRNPFAFRKD